MGFWGSLFGGSNPTVNAGIQQAGDTSTWATSKGKNLMGGAADWLSGLMSGDTAKTAKLLAPQIATQEQQAQQQKQKMAQFGNRSGGINAAAQTIDDKTRANINSMISTLTGSAVSGAGSMGQGMIDTGLKALGQQFDMSQQQMENWSNSIFGQGLTAGAGFLEKGAMTGFA